MLHSTIRPACEIGAAVYQPAGAKIGHVAEIKESDAGSFTIGGAGLDVSDTIVQVDLQDAVQLDGGDDDAIVISHASTRQPRAGAARDDLSVMLRQHFNNGDDFFVAHGKHHRGRPSSGDGKAVTFIDEQLGWIDHNSVRREHDLQFGDQQL